jgi:hypothetical protein
MNKIELTEAEQIRRAYNRERIRKWRANNPDKVRATERRRRPAKRAYNAAYYASHAEAEKARMWEGRARKQLLAPDSKPAREPDSVIYQASKLPPPKEP